MPDARIFADLKRDHDRQRKLLEQVGETSGDSAERRKLFETLRLELQALLQQQPPLLRACFATRR